MADPRLLQIIVSVGGAEYGEVVDADLVQAEHGAGFEDALEVLRQESYIEWKAPAGTIVLTRRSWRVALQVSGWRAPRC